MKKTGSFIILILIALLLYTTKPTEQDFHEFVTTEWMPNSGDNTVQKLIRGGLSLQSKYTTEYEDMIFFSLVSTKIARNEYQFIGILGQWYKISTKS